LPRCSSTLDNLVKGIKGCTNNFDAILCDRTKVQGSASEVADLVNFCKSIGVTLKQKQLSTVLLPNTPVSLCCYCWMERYFDAMGDYQPISSTHRGWLQLLFLFMYPPSCCSGIVHDITFQYVLVHDSVTK
jgi:hypothetical protein